MTAIPPPDARNLQRLRYWQGQMLRSRDFRDQLAIEGQLRCWHNRAMHNAFGVASGFKVLGASLFTSLFSEGDFIHLDAFVAKLRTQDPTQDPVSKFLWSEFSALTKEVLKSATSTPEQQKS